MFRVSAANLTLLIFIAFLLAGASALAATAVLFSGAITDAVEGVTGPVPVIVLGALIGTLSAYIVHEITALVPGIVRVVTRSRA